jgi:hypothetical protein
MRTQQSWNEPETKQDKKTKQHRSFHLFRVPPELGFQLGPCVGLEEKKSGRPCHAHLAAAAKLSESLIC